MLVCNDLSLGSTRCPACDHDQATPWGSDADCTIYRCAQCGTTFFSRPIPQRNTYEEYYNYLPAFDLFRMERELAIRRRQNKSKIRRLKRHLSPSQRRLLDVGAGPGYFLKHALDDGFQVEGVEINSKARQKGIESFGLKYIDVAAARYEDYDVVCLFHVLEHVEEPYAFLRDICARLPEKALVFIHVPVFESAGSRIEYHLKRALGRRRSRRGCLYLPDHLTGFSKDGILALFKRVGIAPLELQPVTIFDAEYDPLFFRFNWKNGTFLRHISVELLKGMFDSLPGLDRKGAWISVVGKVGCERAAS
jgi:SAM-dependent methyltransferase